jgi:hypothetical protein
MNTANTANTVYITMFYDSYEKEYGDGFYPVNEKDATCNSEIIIQFKLFNTLFWKQTTSTSIDGLDGDQGLILLNKINEMSKNKGTTIFNKNNNIIYKK